LRYLLSVNRKCHDEAIGYNQSGILTSSTVKGDLCLEVPIPVGLYGEVVALLLRETGRARR
jgi:hypothetical protein